MSKKALRDAKKKLGRGSRRMNRKRKKTSFFKKTRRIRFSDWTRTLRRNLTMARRKKKK